LSNKKEILFGLISLVLTTATITFVVTLYMLGGINVSNNAVKFNDKEVSKESIKKFNEIKSILKNSYYEKVNEDKILEGAITGMADSLNDPYTMYFTKEQMRSFTERSEGEYVGVGINVIMDNNGILNVVEAFEGSPAKAAGFRQGDKIVKVDGKDVTGIKDENMIIKMIKGKENTTVKISLYRPSEEKTLDFNVLRKKIKIVNLKYEMLPGNIGYIKILMFDDDCYSYFSDYLNELLKKKMKGLIIDVRDNPGGDYQQVVKIADRLLPEGTIVYTEDNKKRKEIEPSDKTELNCPIAILVNGNSASASEVLSGAVKDHKKGKLVGTKTFGKGLVQQVFGFDDGSGLKVTIARYFTPSGKCIQGIGIEPDIKVEVLEKYKDYPISEVPRAEDTQLKKAIEYVGEQIR